MGFATALSGLAAASTNLQVIGNNIANANTTGFKESRAEFADVYNSQGKTQPGAGVRVTEVAQQFNQGNIESTSNNLDLALSGNGFFALGENSDSTSATAYTRNGAFHLSPDGYITNDTGHFLMGGAPIGSSIDEGFSTGAPEAIRIDTSQGEPSATTTIDLKVNLDSREGRPATPFSGYDPAVSTGPDVDSYNSSTSATIFDSLGNTHTLATYFVDETPDGAAESTWAAYVYIDGKGINSGATATLDEPNSTVSAAINAVANNPTVAAASTAATTADNVATLAATSLTAAEATVTAATVTETAYTDVGNALTAALSALGTADTTSNSVNLAIADAAVKTLVTAAQDATAAADAAVVAANSAETAAQAAADADLTSSDLADALTAATAAVVVAEDVVTGFAALAQAAEDLVDDNLATPFDDAAVDAAILALTAPTATTTAITDAGVAVSAFITTEAALVITDATDAATSTAASATTANATAADAAAAEIALVTDVTTQQTTAATAAAALSGATVASVILAASSAEMAGTKIPMTFDSLGNLITDTTGTNAASGSGDDNFVFTGLQIYPEDSLNVSAEALTISINPTGSSQYASDFGVNDLQQNGYASGNLTGVSVDKTGVVLARYSNGTTSPLGQVILGRFTNNQGLGKIGDTTWQESIESGTVVLGVAGGNNFGDITSSSLENSNTDIATQLVKMIVAQQSYQANAQTISTEDEIIQRILQL